MDCTRGNRVCVVHSTSNNEQMQYASVQHNERSTIPQKLLPDRFGEERARTQQQIIVTALVNITFEEFTFELPTTVAHS